MLRPPTLRIGDCIGIMAPASPVREEFLSVGEDLIRSLGFRLRRGAHLNSRDRYTAGTCEERANDLVTLLGDPEVRAIWMARGGYGSPHLIPHLDGAAFAANPKLLIGASDITALLLWSLAQGVTCLHGPMPAQELARGRVDRDGLVHHLTQTDPIGRLPGEMRRLHPGVGRGRLTGGCLSLVVASLGTSWEIQTDDAILFLEDTHTKPYQIDRMLTQLDQAGKLHTVRGIAFGEMPGCVQTAEQGYTLDEVLGDLTARLGVPVVAGLPCGHTTGTHHALPLGVLATLDADRLELTLHESVTG